MSGFAGQQLGRRAAGFSPGAVEKSHMSQAPGHGSLEHAAAQLAQPHQEASPLLRNAPEQLSCRGEGQPPWRCPGHVLRGAPCQTLFLLDGARLMVYLAA